MRAPIRNLVQAGMNTDLPPYDLPPNAVTSAVNVEFRDGAVERAWGFSREHEVTGDAVWMEAWFSQGNGRAIVVSENATNTIFEEVIGATVTDITPAVAITNGLEWDSEVFGTSAIFTTESLPPYARGISDTGELLAMPNWPETWRAPIIRAYRNFLVALRVQRDGVEDDTRIQWSNASANNGLPPDWDSLDAASLAGGTSLAGHNGPIQDAATLGQSLIIYMQTATYAMALGGASVMNVRPLFNRGLLDRYCVIPYDEYHFCIGNGAIYIHDGSSIQYPAEDTVQTRFFNEMQDPASIHLSNDAGKRVIEVYYKSNEDLAFPDRVLRWNYQTNTWSFNDLDGFGVVRSLYAPDSQRLVSWDSIDTDIGGGSVVAWNDSGFSWRELDVEPGRLSLKLLARTDTGSAVMRREGVYLRDGVAYESVLEREGIDFDQILPGEGNPWSIEAVKHLRGVTPQVIGSGTVYFQFGTSMTPGGSTEWGSITPYDIGSDYKVDFRASGRYFAWRMFNKVDEPASFRVSGFDLDIQVDGER